MNPDEQKRASIKRGESLIRLQESDEWLAIAEIFDELSKRIRQSILRVDLAAGAEHIAMEHIAKTSRLAGLEDFFRVINDDIETYKQAISERKNPDPKKPKYKNPYREESSDV